MPDFLKKPLEEKVGEMSEGEINREEESTIEDEFENPKSVTDKLTVAKDFLVKRGKEALGWISKQFGFNKKDKESMEAELGRVEEDASEALKQAKGDLTDKEFNGTEATEGIEVTEAAGVTKVEGLKSRRDLGLKTTITETESGEINPDDLVYKGQASFSEHLSAYEERLENSGFSEAKVNQEIYREILSSLIERASGSSLEKETSVSEQIENMKLQQESDQDALDKLNTQEELNDQDIEQIKALKKDIQDLDDRLFVLESSEKDLEKKDSINGSDKEREDIKNSLTFLCREGTNATTELNKLIQTLYVERNMVEIELDPREAQNNEVLQKDVDYYRKFLKEGEIFFPVGNPRAYEGIIKTDKNKGSKIEVIDSAGKIVEETTIEKLPTLRDKYRIGEMKGLRLKLELTKEQKERIEYNLKEKEKLLAAKPAEGEKKEELERRIDNLTKIMKIVSEVQKKYKKLNKALGDQKNFTDTARKFNIGSSEMSKVLQLKQKREIPFLRAALQERDNREESKIVEDFVGGLVREVREAT